MARPVPLEALSSSDEEDLGDADLDSAAGLAASGAGVRPGGGGDGADSASDLSQDDDRAESISEPNDSNVEELEGNSECASVPAASLRSYDSDGNSQPSPSRSEGDPPQQADAAASRGRGEGDVDAESFPEVSSSGSEGGAAELEAGTLNASRAAIMRTGASDGNGGGAASAGGAAASAEVDTDAAGPFKSKDKGAAIAKAFAKVTHGRTEDKQAGAAILSGSKSVLKRQREEAMEEATDRKAKVLRQEMRKRGHAKIPRRGEEPTQDATEKLLLRTARKGVVRLFNAVSKAQKQVVEEQAVGGRTKGQQLTKADFLAELRGKGAVANAAKAPRGAKGAAGVSPSEQAAPSDVPAWAPLRDDDLAVLSRGMKMKDWDKSEEQPGVIEETLEDEADSDAD